MTRKVDAEHPLTDADVGAMVRLRNRRVIGPLGCRDQGFRFCFHCKTTDDEDGWFRWNQNGENWLRTRYDIVSVESKPATVAEPRQVTACMSCNFRRFSDEWNGDECPECHGETVRFIGDAPRPAPSADAKMVEAGEAEPPRFLQKRGRWFIRTDEFRLARNGEFYFAPGTTGSILEACSDHWSKERHIYRPASASEVLEAEAILSRHTSAEVTQLREELEKARETNQRLNRRCQEYERGLRDRGSYWQCKFNVERDKVTSLEAELEKARERIKELEHENQGLRAIFNKPIDDDEQKRINEAAAQCAMVIRLGERLASLESSLTACQDELEAARKEIERFKRGNFYDEEYYRLPVAKLIAGLRSELRHQTNETDHFKQKAMSLESATLGDFWAWMGDGNDHPESLTCRVVCTPEQVREWTSLESSLSACQEENRKLREQIIGPKGMMEIEYHKSQGGEK